MGVVSAGAVVSGLISDTLERGFVVANVMLVAVGLMMARG